MNSQRHGGQRSTSVTFSTPEIPGAVYVYYIRILRQKFSTSNHGRVRIDEVH